VFILIIAGFVSLLVFEGVMDECGVEAANTWYVGTGQTHTKIQDAIDNASSGDTIRVYSGIYYENVIVNKTLTLIGNGSKNTIVDGNGFEDVMLVIADWVNISKFSITNSGNSVSTGDGGLKLSYSENCKIDNYSISNNGRYGLCIWHYSKNNIIEYNNLSNNEYGVSIWDQSNNNKFISNDAINNTYTGFLLTSSSRDNIFLNNNLISNVEAGISFGMQCYRNIARNNKMKSNNYGIYNMWGVESVITGNTFINNYRGIELGTLDNEIIDNNFSNNEIGILINSYYGHIINNNSFLQNRIAIRVSSSDENYFINNTISNNEKGINFTRNSRNNIFTNNLISENTWGINVTFHSNTFYHNNIINNTNQLSNSGYNNDWNNNDDEGNYWSDYFGFDNGANGSVKGDGIGDTHLPHQGVDDFPFMIRDGWIYPTTPIVGTPPRIDSDGNFTISWYNNPRAEGYIVEEDVSPNFNSPTIYSRDWYMYMSNNSIYIFGKDETTHYYRVKAYKNDFETGWSNVVNITVDYLPKAPKNLAVTRIPEGNSLHISWDSNQEDTVKYGLYYSSYSSFHILAYIDHPKSHFIHTGLQNGLIYKYKICAYDSRNQSSYYSEIVEGIPQDIVCPSIPTGFNGTPIPNRTIVLNWDANNETDLDGYEIYMRDLSNTSTEEFELKCSLSQMEISYTFSNLSEKCTYQFKINAFDEVPNYSLFSEIVMVTTFDETPPTKPTGLRVFNNTNNSLTISWDPNPDADIFGYRLFRNESLVGNYKEVMKQNLIRQTEFVDTGLNETTIYYYKIMAIDDCNLTSPFSEEAFGRTTQTPRPPVINNSIADFKINEDTVNNHSINLYHLFRDPNNDELNFSVAGQKNFQVIIYQINGTVILIPEKNWNGQETLTFTAFDGHFLISDKIVITVKAVNDPPEQIEIVEPNEGLVIEEGENIDFFGNGTDPDLPYGDTLIFTWTSTIDGQIGDERNLTGIQLSEGKHNIYLKVTDEKGESRTDMIGITVLPKADSNPSGFEGNALTFLVTGISIIIVIILLIYFMVIKGKRIIRFEPETTPTKVESEVTQQPTITPQQLPPQTPVQSSPQFQPLPMQQLQYQPPQKPNMQPLPKIPQPQNQCSTCGQQLTFIQSKNRYYCYQCKKYD
jgi:parallel beta-helix repeat protein